MKLKKWLRITQELGFKVTIEPITKVTTRKFLELEELPPLAFACKDVENPPDFTETDDLPENVYVNTEGLGCSVESPPEDWHLIDAPAHMRSVLALCGRFVMVGNARYERGMNIYTGSRSCEACIRAGLASGVLSAELIEHDKDG